MTRRVLVLLPLLLASCGGGKTPLGQPPLNTLSSTNFSQLRERFNRDAGHTRIVVLLSPT
jgi:hypothetical protein